MPVSLNDDPLLAFARASEAEVAMFITGSSRINFGSTMRVGISGILSLASVSFALPLLAQEQTFNLEFQGSVSRAFYVRRSGSTEPNVVLINDQGSPFTLNDGYCFLAGISHDMDEQQRKRERVYQHHRSPFLYHVGFDLETGNWSASAIGGAPGSWAAIRCVKF